MEEGKLSHYIDKILIRCNKKFVLTTETRAYRKDQGIIFFLMVKMNREKVLDIKLIIKKTMEMQYL